MLAVSGFSRLKSSAYLHKRLSSHKVQRAAMNIINRTGPSPDPCTILCVIGNQFDSLPSNFTDCVRPLKKLAIQLKMLGGILRAFSFWRRMRWLMESNAFDKSIRQRT